MRLSLVCSVFAACLCGTSVGASTYVVDDDGGAGVDFTDIATAIGVCVPGDVIVVRAGNYTGFALDLAISIVGEAGAVVAGGIQIYGTPANARTTLAGLETRWITIDACDGPVTLEELVARPGPGDFSQDLTVLGALVTVTDCSDVRLRGLDAKFLGPGNEWHALRVVSSRVEVTHSVLEGAPGKGNGDYYVPAQPKNGGDGIRAMGTATLHVSSSYVHGGAGGMYSTPYGFYGGGAGGAGMSLFPGTTALVSGPDWCWFYGGTFGWSWSPYDDGPPGSGILVQAGAELRISTANVESGINEAGNPHPTPPPIAGAHEQAVPADPILIIGDVVSVQPTQFTVQGQSGDQVFLHLGRKLVVVPLAGVFVPQLTEPLRTYNLGILPASGQATFTFTIPTGYPKGAFFVAQARTIDGEGNVAFTQSMPLTVR